MYHMCVPCPQLARLDVMPPLDGGGILICEEEGGRGSSQPLGHMGSHCIRHIWQMRRQASHGAATRGAGGSPWNATFRLLGPPSILSILVIRAVIVLAMLERRLLTDASSSSTPEVQSESEGMGAAQVACLFVAFPFLVVLNALFLGGMMDSTH